MVSQETVISQQNDVDMPSTEDCETNPSNAPSTQSSQGRVEQLSMITRSMDKHPTTQKRAHSTTPAEGKQIRRIMRTQQEPWLEGEEESNLRKLIK
ncbi:unnamed protein product [Phytophthora lilii]|uniref:Unnamed protein product n=1 Tax=Phytophthora lilii TaxID=2077276 RepID=A0A9W6X622_9STRA|nr:unnamed protein product [Phytophthora lilii]